MKIGIYKDSEEVYNSEPHLRASYVKEMHTSPGHFLNAKNSPPKESKVFDAGRAKHAALLLQSTDGFIRRPDGIDGRTKEGKAKLEELKATGKIVLDGDVFDSMEKCLDTFVNSETAMSLYNGAEIEKSHYVQDPQTGLCLKARPDIAKPGMIADLKTTSFMPTFEKQIWNLKYHIQVGFYSLVMEISTGAEFNNFYFIAQESNAPHGIKVFSLDRAAVEFCKTKARALLNQIAICTEHNTFPIFEDKINQVTVPNWVLENDFSFEEVG